jgi:hypothetical protein
MERVLSRENLVFLLVSSLIQQFSNAKPSIDQAPTYKQGSYAQSAKTQDRFIDA